MDDLISRQAAIDALMVWEEESIWDEECLEHRGEPFLTAPSDVVEQLPSAQPERCEDCRNFNKARLLIPQTERKKEEGQE